MTRITESMVYGSMQRNIERGQANLLERNEQASTGRRVSKPSDDPVAFDREMVLRSVQRRLGAMEEVSNRVRDDLSVTESALNDAQNIMTRTREIAIAAGNGILSDDDRQAYAQELGEMREAMLALANSEIAGRYVFSGNATGTPPFAADGSFVGDGTAREVEVLDGRSVQANVPGNSVFAGGTAVDVFNLMDDLRADLNANDPATATSRLGDIETALRQIEDGRTQTGVAVDALNDADTLRGDIDLRLEEAVAESVGVDQAESYVKLLEAQSAMQSALLQAARILEGFQQSPLF